MANQGSISIFNFLVSIYIIKLYSVSEFGIYSVVFTLGLGAVSFQNAFISTPMSIRIKKRVLGRTSKYLSFYHTISLIYLSFLLIICAIVQIYVDFPGWLLGLYLVSYTLRDYCKNILLLDYKVKLVTKVELIFIFLSLSFLVIFFALDIYNIRVLIATLSVCSMLSLFTVNSKINFGFKFNLLIVYRFYKIKIWSISKWAVLGVLVTEIYSRSYIFIITTFYSVEILGLVQAGRVLFGPMNLLINGWIKISRNHLAALVGQNNLYGFRKFFYLSILGFVSLNFVSLLLVFLLWDIIESNLFNSIDESVYLTTILWGVAVAIVQIRMIVSTSLQAFEVFKVQTFFNIASSIVTLTSILWICYYLSWEYMPLGIAIGECMLCFLSVMYYKKISKNS